MTVEINFRKLKFIFIDFDGTLVDTVPLLFDHYSNFLKKYGQKGTLEEFKSLMGPAIEEFIPILQARHTLPQNPQELVQVYMQGLDERYKQEAKLIKGSKEFLEYAKTLDLTLILVTSTAYPLIEGSLENLDLKKYFNHIITGDKVKKTKPDPEIYLLALKTCSAKSEEALAIEDSYNGLLSSMQANIPTIAIQNEHLLKMPHQVMIIKNWGDLLDQFRNAYEK